MGIDYIVSSEFCFERCSPINQSALSWGILLIENYTHMSLIAISTRHCVELYKNILEKSERVRKRNF